MAGDAVVSFKDKLRILIRLAKIDAAKLQADLSKLKKIRKVRSGVWLADDAPIINSKYRQLFVEYWNEAHKIPFAHECFPMPLKEFQKYIDSRPEQDAVDFPVASTSARSEPQGEGISKFAGTYQIIRPHTHEADRYVLEALEIIVDGDEVTNLMYSHTNSFLYEGKGHASTRYFSSLLIRQHEEFAEKTAFRCITLYVGYRALTKRLCGLMLRGVTAEKAGSQAVAIPFIGLRVPENFGLRTPDNGPRDRNEPYCLHNGGHILVGTVSKKKKVKEIFDWCEEVFDTIKSMKNGLFYNDQKIVLHTIAPTDLLEVDALDYERWKQLVDNYAVTATVV